MKFDDLSKKEPDTHQEAKQKQEFKYKGELHVRYGCKLFALNLTTKKVFEVKPVEKAEIKFNGMITKNAKALHQEGFIYFQAINLKNAKRKAKRYLSGETDLALEWDKKFQELPFKNIIYSK